MDERSGRLAELFNDSLQRCLARSGFLDRFYECFLASSDEVREAFANTDFKRQKRMLRRSLFTLMIAAGAGSPPGAELEPIARRHSRRDLDVRPELYAVWLDCLLRAVRECDPAFEDEVDHAWRTLLAPGIEFMKSRY